MATDQEYCLECGARRVPSARERWRRPLIAAVLTVVAGLALVIVLYLNARSQADNDAKAAVAVSRKAPSGEQGRGGSARQARPARSAPRPSP